MDLKYYAQNSTHLPVTMRLVAETSGRILELGTGQYSTPFLHFACYPKKRTLVSYEDDKLYYQAAKQFENDYHLVKKVDDWTTIDIQRHWEVALIDQTPYARRIEDIKRLAWWTTYIIVPRIGSTPDDDALIEQVTPEFRHRSFYRDFLNTQTLVLSNLVDVSSIRW